ncbi:MAG TPA: cation:proton antiporter [Burkholderiales bacterium]
MEDLAFLPQLPLFVSQLLWFGLLLLAGLLAGELARAHARLPRVTGYVLVGAALGPEASGLLTRDMLFDLRLLIDLSIGIVVVELGFRLSLEWLQRNRWLSLAALAESALCFSAIFATLLAFGFRPLLAAMAAAIGTATSPAVITILASDLRAEGQVTERMLLFTAVNTVFAYVAVMLLLPFLHIEQGRGLATALLHPVYVFAGSLALGWLACRLLLVLARWLGKREDRQFVLLVATVVLTIGVAHTLNFSVALALITLGVLARNRDRHHALAPVRFGPAGQLFYVILFVLTGAGLEFRAFGVAALVAVAAFILVRFAGKALAVVALAPSTGLGVRAGGWLAVALLPLSGQAVIMVRDTVTLYPSFGRELAAIVLSAVVVLELIGPIATQIALKRAGEARPDA